MMGVMEVKGLHTLICEVSDMDRAVAFYRDVLGFTPGYLDPHWSSLRAGTTTIGLHPPFTEAAPVRGGGWVFGMEVDDMRAFRQKLTEAGVALGDYHDTPSGAILDFTDPDGNRLQVIQPGLMSKDLVW